MIHCANCTHCKVTWEKTTARKKSHMVRCVHNLWPENSPKRGWMNVYAIREKHPADPHHCLSYDSMGEYDLQDYLDALPIKEAYQEVWLKGRGR
jgi:hypothetical protein